MSTNPIISVHRIPQLPDPSSSQYQAIADGDVRAAIAEGCEHLLRTLSNMPSGSTWQELRFVFDPKADNRNRQSRLSLYFVLGATDKAIHSNLIHLLKGGLLGRFYEFDTVPKVPSEKQLFARCYLVRQEGFVQPLYNCDFNARIPERYYTVQSFEANSKNNYLTLDRVLDRIDERVIICIKVGPVDISQQLHAHTSYLARLSSINRTLYNDDCASLDCLNSVNSGYKNSDSKPIPLQYKDPLADDILRQQKRFHETLRQSHLRFRIQIAAETEAVARLVGSVLAESAFEDGSYSLIIDKDMKDFSSRAIDNGNENENVPPLPFEPQYKDAYTDCYRTLRLLRQVATVDELLGVFRLPVASFSSPCCIRKNTDPPNLEEDDMIGLGYDAEADFSMKDVESSLLRGILIKQLKKHLFVSGISGTGKSTSVKSILIQLYNGRWCWKQDSGTDIKATKKTKKTSKKSNRRNHSKAI